MSFAGEEINSVGGEDLIAVRTEDFTIQTPDFQHSRSYAPPPIVILRPIPLKHKDGPQFDPELENQ
jgi:hypothetical protein